ncbi:MAG: universal stress protein [Sandarakinorhabdus sp.]|nr:universal stress protein [Sandarakinorhabdus sp.]
MRILAASDLSARSSRALARSFQLAVDTRAELKIIHVGATETLSEARSRLEAEVDRNRSWAGIDASLTIVPGDPKAEVAGTAARWGADLVVMGSHQPERRRPGAFAHTLAGDTLQRLGRPVLLAESPVQGSHGTAVVGVDFSIFSRTAIRAARRFAPHAMLHLVHAYKVPFNSLMLDKSYAQDFAYAERLEFDEFVAEEMARQQQRAITDGIPGACIQTHMREGNAGEVLRAMVKETGATLAVVGTHGRTGIARLLLGSVATGLVDDPPCDVLVVPMAMASNQNRDGP